jgi:hypothetical protein
MYYDEELTQLVSAGKTNKELMAHFNKSHTAIRKRIEILGLTSNKKITVWHDEVKFVELVKINVTKIGVLRGLGVSTKSGNFQTFDRYVKKYNVDTSHFTGSYTPNPLSSRNLIPLSEVMVEHSTYTRASLKRRLLQDGILSNECSVCGLGDKWEGKPIVHQLDHINGVNDDNRIENLRIICCNCHSQTSTFSGRNQEKKHSTSTRYKDCKCGNKIEKKTNMCQECDAFGRRTVERPSPTQLIEDLTYDIWTVVGKKYGVAENTIRKWCRSYDLPTDRKMLQHLHVYNKCNNFETCEGKLLVIKERMLELSGEDRYQLNLLSKRVYGGEEVLKAHVERSGEGVASDLAQLDEYTKETWERDFNIERTEPFKAPEGVLRGEVDLDTVVDIALPYGPEDGII